MPVAAAAPLHAWSACMHCTASAQTQHGLPGRLPTLRMAAATDLSQLRDRQADQADHAGHPHHWAKPAELYRPPGEQKRFACCSWQHQHSRYIKHFHNMTRAQLPYLSCHSKSSIWHLTAERCVVRRRCRTRTAPSWARRSRSSCSTSCRRRRAARPGRSWASRCAAILGHPRCYQN